MIYGNEEAIGNTLQEIFAEGSVKREELFITTKLWRSDYEDIEGAIRLSLKKLKLEYLDLYLVHWPIPKIDWENEEMPFLKTPMHKVWAEMERMVELGLTKSIGVSNFQIPMMMDLFTYCKIRPAVNQIELHPYLVQDSLVKFHKRYNVHVTAYAPLGAFAWPYKRPQHKDLSILREKTILDLATKYGKGIGQIVLNWHLHRGHTVIPKTSKVERLRENIAVTDFQLTQEEYDSITALDQNARFYDPELMQGDFWKGMPFWY